MAAPDPTADPTADHAYDVAEAEVESYLLLLADIPRYTFRHLRHARVRGINRLGADVLRRAEAETPNSQRQ